MTSNAMNLIKIGDFAIGIPQEKMYDVATLKTDLRPAITHLRNLANESRSKRKVITPVRHTCRKGCPKSFINLRRRRIHEGKYHDK